MRKFLGVPLGIVVAFVTISIVEMVGHAIWPPPANLDMGDPEQLARLMEQVPLGAKISVVVAWFAGALDGALVARLVSRREASGWIVAALLAVAGGFTLVLIPHPLWMQVAAVAFPFLGAWIASLIRLPG